MVCIRPKDISLYPNDPGIENTFPAKIIVKTFAGDFYKVLISPLQKPEMEVLAHVYDYEKATFLEEGKTIYIHFPPACCKLIKGT
jgi:hypothetical protein